MERPYHTLKNFYFHNIHILYYRLQKVLKSSENRGYNNCCKTEFKEHMKVDRGGIFELIPNRIRANIYKTPGRLFVICLGYQ